MPPKSKQFKSEWYQCSNCTTTFSSRDLNLHASFCTEDKPFVYKHVDSLTAVKHGFVVEDILLAASLQNDGKYNLDEVHVVSAFQSDNGNVCLGVQWLAFSPVTGGAEFSPCQGCAFRSMIIARPRLDIYTRPGTVWLIALKSVRS